MTDGYEWFARDSTSVELSIAEHASQVYCVVFFFFCRLVHWLISFSIGICLLLLFRIEMILREPVWWIQNKSFQTLGGDFSVDGRFGGSLNVTTIDCKASNDTSIIIPVSAPGFELELVLFTSARPIYNLRFVGRCSARHVRVLPISEYSYCTRTYVFFCSFLLFYYYNNYLLLVDNIQTFCTSSSVEYGRYRDYLNFKVFDWIVCIESHDSIIFAASDQRQIISFIQ